MPRSLDARPVRDRATTLCQTPWARMSLTFVALDLVQDSCLNQSHIKCRKLMTALTGCIIRSCQKVLITRFGWPHSNSRDAITRIHDTCAISHIEGENTIRGDCP